MLTVAKQGCVNKQNVYSGSVAFTGSSDTFIEYGSIQIENENRISSREPCRSLEKTEYSPNAAS